MKLHRISTAIFAWRQIKNQPGDPMKKELGSLFKCMALATACTVAPAYAAVVSFHPNVDFTNQSVTFDFGGDSFTLADNGSGFASPVSIKTAGSAAVSSTTIFGLMPASYFDPSPSQIFDGNPFLQYFSYPDFASIPFSGPPTIIGLRTGLANDFHYGYAQFQGTFLKSYAFENIANLGIQSGAVSAVPEPETWIMLIAGLGLIGAMAIRRNSAPSIGAHPHLAV
jgi:hypothetical protein